jgi:hypothetical protein
LDLDVRFSDFEYAVTSRPDRHFETAAEPFVKDFSRLLVNELLTLLRCT